LKKFFLLILELIAKYKVNDSVFVGDGSVICCRKISLKNECRVYVGQNSLIEGRICFDKEFGEIVIGNRTFIGNSTLVCAEKITIGDDVLMAWGCTVVDHNSHSLVWDERSSDVLHWIDGKKDWTHVKCAQVTIENKVWIGFNVILLKGVRIGEGAVVAAGSVVSRDVPPYTVVAGNPAKVVRELGPDER